MEVADRNNFREDFRCGLVSETAMVEVTATAALATCLEEEGEEMRGGGTRYHERCADPNDISTEATVASNNPGG